MQLVDYKIVQGVSFLLCARLGCGVSLQKKKKQLTIDKQLLNLPSPQRGQGVIVRSANPVFPSVQTSSLSPFCSAFFSSVFNSPASSVWAFVTSSLKQVLSHAVATPVLGPSWGCRVVSAGMPSAWQWRLFWLQECL